MNIVSDIILLIALLLGEVYYRLCNVKDYLYRKLLVHRIGNYIVEFKIPLNIIKIDNSIDRAKKLISISAKESHRK